ncbi:MAG: hypothetical protein ACYCZI_08205 [Metallibacterium scheffleri]
MNAYASLIRSARMVHVLRPWVLYACLVMLALMAGVMLFTPPHHPHAFAFGFFAAVCWALVGSRLLLVQRALRHARVPDVGRGIGIALALLAVPTVALPVLVLASIHELTLASLALLLLCNVAGLLWSLAPMLVSIAIALAPSAVGLLSPLPELAWLRLPRDTQGPALLVLALALAAFVAWLWRAWLDRDPAECSALSVPWVMRMGDLPGFGLMASTVANQRMLQRRDRRGMRRRLALPMDDLSPAMLIRQLLGPPYALGGRERLAMLAICLLSGLGGTLGGWLLHWSATGMVLALGGMAMMIMLLPLASVTLSLRLKATPDFLTELALLPCLGTPAAARKHVLHAMLGRAQRDEMLMALAALLLAFALGAPPSVLILMLALTALALVAHIAVVLNVLAMRPDPSLLRRALLPFGWFAVIALVTATGLFVIGHGAGAGSGINRAIILVLGIGWAITISTLLTRIALDWRRFQRRPHPFVQR